MNDSNLNTDVVMEHDEAIASRIEKQADKIKDGYDRWDAWAIIETFCAEVEMHSLLVPLAIIATAYGADKETAQSELELALESILEKAAKAQAIKDVANNDDIEDDYDLEDVA